MPSTPPHPSDPPLRIDLLDGVVARLGDAAVDLGSGRPRALVARLALDPGTLASSAELIADLWSDPPPSADVTLRSIVSRLRGGPLRDHLTGGRGGYSLAVGPDAVDVTRLRRALRIRGDARERRRALETLEAAWTGRALAGVEEAPFARRERARLEAEYAAAVEELAVLRLEEGDTDRVLQAMRDLIHRDPVADRPVVLLATALSRDGRDGEALRAIDELGERLRRDTGLDVPPSVLALRTAILRRELAPATPGPEPERLGVPLPMTAFVGRRAELEALVEARSRSRLVTIVGPGGVGKTRLAIEAVRRDGTRDDRQVFLDLVPLRDEASVVAALADLVGALRPDIAAIAAALRDRATLLVLDNAEHLRDAVAHLVVELVARCDGLSVLVTSRDPLRIPGERRVRVDPLLGDGLADAVQLFADRASEIDPHFALDATTEPLVRRLAAAVDGIPLALELAAARLPARPLDELVREVRARGIVGHPRGRGRHADVTSLIEWSTDLLTPAERELLVQLGGFAGGFSHAAATAICRVDGEHVDDLLLELVDRSLVSVSRTAGGATEYRLLIAVRQVARSLGDADDDEWRARHRRWHADLVDEWRPRLYTADEAEATAVLERVANDLNAAVADAIATGDREAALRIVGGMARVWYRRASFVDGAARIAQALGIPGRVSPIVEARAHLGHGLIRFFMREEAAAEEAITAAVDEARAAADPSILAVALAFRGYLAGATGRPEVARASLGEAGRIGGLSPAAGCTVAMIAADLHRASGAPGSALAALDRAHRLARQAGEGWIVTLTAHLTAKVLIATRRGQEAIDLLVPVIHETWDAGRPTHTIAGIVLVAAATTTLERHAVGARLLAAADAHARRFSWDPDANDPEGNRVYRGRLRDALTAEEWRAELSAGAALSLPDAIAACAALASPVVRRRVRAA